MLRLLLTGGFNGCGYMVLYIRVPEKPIGGYYPLSIGSFSSEFEQILPSNRKVGAKKRVVLVVDGAGWH
jgi:hypothetical protein